MGYAAAVERRLDRFVHEVIDVRRPHHALVIHGHVHKQFVEVHVLLGVSADQIVEGVAGYGEHRLHVALGVVKAIEQMNSSRPRSRQADAQPSRVFGIATGGERGGFFVTRLNEPDPVLARAQRFKNSVDAVSWKSENYVHAPINQSLNEQISGSHRHLQPPFDKCPGATCSAKRYCRLSVRFAAGRRFAVSDLSRSAPPSEALTSASALSQSFTSSPSVLPRSS